VGEAAAHPRLSAGQGSGKSQAASSKQSPIGAAIQAMVWVAASHGLQAASRSVSALPPSLRLAATTSLLTSKVSDCYARKFFSTFLKNMFDRRSIRS
jgi:hypothetical protein